MKTIKEWLSELPEPYRKQAMANAPSLSEKSSTIFHAINSFLWEKTPEGFEYWKQVERHLQFGEGLPYAGQLETPTNALSALHAIALKKGFPVEDIESVKKWTGDTTWAYTLVGITDEWLYIDLKPE